MARTHGKLLCSVWSDPDFTSLSAGAQRMFMLIVSQPKLSICGVIDYVPARWALCAPGMTVEDVEELVGELETRRYVHVDRGYSELLVRSFVKNDGVCQKWPMLKAMWSAYTAVSSPALRERLVEALPEEAWTSEKATPPASAVALRVRLRVQPVVQPGEGPPATTTATTTAMSPDVVALGLSEAREALR